MTIPFDAEKAFDKIQQPIASNSDQQKGRMTQCSSQSSLFRNLSTSCMNLSLGIVSCVCISAPNCNPLYILSTTPHQPSPHNSSPLARIITHHMVWSCIMVHLRSSHDGCGLFSGVWGSQVQVIKLGCSPGLHLGTAATPAPHSYTQQNWKTWIKWTNI